MKQKRIYTAYNFGEYGESKITMLEDNKVVAIKNQQEYIKYEGYQNN